MDNTEKGRDRLYQELARKLIESFAAENYKPGDRLPAEREVAATYDVSRPTVREALIALEAQGIVDVRVGSGAYFKGLPPEDRAAFGMSAFEITEARLLVESDVAALAASQITDDELDGLANFLNEMDLENERNTGTESADREFHLAIAKATRNSALVSLVDSLWTLRANSPESALLYAKARSANVKPVVDEHRAILDALRSRDSERARHAMRAHLIAVLDSLLFATEEKAIAEARRSVQSQRDRYTRILA